jgi:hypothetical protein
MVDSPKSEISHDSSLAATKNRASKDKECPYCHQDFTSSSLGRHLDQYIFRKKPDGLHNVDEIRRLRGGITRRTAKGGVQSKQDREGSLSTPHPTSPANRYSPAEDTRVDLNATPEEGYRVQLNVPNWQSTGVINGLPGSSTVSPALEHIISTAGAGKRKYTSLETAAAKDMVGLRGDLGSEKDTARALELALREVLDIVQAAQYVSSSSSPRLLLLRQMTREFSDQMCPAFKPHRLAPRFQSTSNLTAFPRSSYISSHHRPTS